MTCSGLANSGVPANASARRDRGLSTGFIDHLGQAQINNLGAHCALLLKAHHDIAWLDVPVNELFLVHRRQTGGDLLRNFQSDLYFKPSRALDETVERFPLHKLHRVEVIGPLPPKVEDRGDVGMADARGGTRFPQKSDPRRLVAEILFADDFQRHRTTQIDVKGLVGDTHRTPTQLESFPVLVEHYFVVFEA